jgi:sodium transport system permease protein
MNWTNVKLILAREIRDQLRDRRTLFMIAVLPILLYPLLGMSFFQISQFMREQTTSVLVIGAKGLTDLPPLLENKQFCPALFDNPDRARLLKVYFAPDEPRGEAREMSDPLGDELRNGAREAVAARRYDAALYFPPDFADRLETLRQAIRDRVERDGQDENGPPSAAGVRGDVPSPEIIYTTANESSQIAFVRLSRVLERWTEEIGRTNLVAAAVPPLAVRPFVLDTADLAEQTGNRGVAMWSKLLPVMLLLWALTGAFYPAIDLCAGEKERGTLETLLSSPAERSEIVLGKLVTIMLFSILTVVLNLLSIGVTGWLLLSRLPGIGPPPWIAIVWLSLALIPISALFSALCLALAAFARSSKEGQYYLMPLLLVTMPLAILPMAPGVELNLGNSLIPITGVVLLLRSLLEGNTWQAVQFCLPVIAVTLGGCLLSIRWAVDQFNAESVLFRESERLDMGLWLQHLLRDRKPTPTVAGAVFCGMVILLVRFFMGVTLPQPEVFRDFAVIAVVTQLVAIVTPMALMTIMLTRSPSRTLLVGAGSWQWSLLLSVPAAALLAVALHPVALALQSVVVRLYPINEQFAVTMAKLLEGASVWQLILLIAVIPAVCEELAFRGFILSGFRHLGHKWRAIIYSALFFGITHFMLQQSLIACVLGVVLGFIAVQSRNIVPCMVFHMVHNTMLLVALPWVLRLVARRPALERIVGSSSELTAGNYHWPVVAAGAVVSLLVLWWFHRLPCEKSDEEKLQGEIRRLRLRP